MGADLPVYKTRGMALAEVLAAVSQQDDSELEYLWDRLVGDQILQSLTITNDEELLNDEENQRKNSGRW